MRIFVYKNFGNFLRFKFNDNNVNVYGISNYSSKMIIQSDNIDMYSKSELGWL